MPPRRPRKGKKQGIAPQDNTVLHRQNDPIKASTSLGHGFEDLPNELLLEIISYLPTLPVPYEKPPELPFKEDEPGLERVKCLRVLSRVSTRLRAFALPYAWDTIHVCSTKHVARNTIEKNLAVRLLMKLEIATDINPSLASYVRVINVYLGLYSLLSVLEEFARCLELLPSLHTIQILVDDIGPSSSVWWGALEGKVFPSIRVLSGDAYAMSVARHCPGVQTFKYIKTDNLVYHPSVQSIIRRLSMESLTEIFGVTLQEDSLSNFVRDFPQTTVITFQTFFIDRLLSKHLPSLRELSHLRSIRVDIRRLKHITLEDYENATVQLIEDLRQIMSSKPVMKNSHNCLVIQEGPSSDTIEHGVVSGHCSNDLSCKYFREMVGGF